jgi:hypothetical protein
MLLVIILHEKTMQRHANKNDYNFISISVMVLEVAAFFIFIFGALGAIYGTYSGIQTTDFIVIGFGGVALAFTLLVFAELLQLLMKIEINTRKADILLAKEVKAMTKASRSTGTRKKTARRKKRK